MDGTDFPPRTLYQIIICVQFHLEKLGLHWKILDYDKFVNIQYTLDNMMKLRLEQGVANTLCQAQVFSHEDENTLWNSGLLGVDTLTKLLNTLVFGLEMSCAMQAGKEHQSISFDSQFSWHYEDVGNLYLEYREDIGTKTNKGGLKHKKLSAKVVNIYPNPIYYQCPLMIFDTYMIRLPVDLKCSLLYLRPKANYMHSDAWFIDAPVGPNKLQSVVKDLCHSAGITGYFTNHHLRATAATCMYNSGVDKQVISGVTCHRSMCVCSYKKTCNNLK